MTRKKEGNSASYRGKSCICCVYIVHFPDLQKVVGVEMCHCQASLLLLIRICECTCTETFLILKSKCNVSMGALCFWCDDWGRTCCICYKFCVGSSTTPPQTFCASFQLKIWAHAEKWQENSATLNTTCRLGTIIWKENFWVSAFVTYLGFESQNECFQILQSRFVDRSCSWFIRGRSVRSYLALFHSVMQQQILFLTQNKHVWRNGTGNCISFFLLC